MDITVRYSSIDRFRKSRKFKTLAGAQKFAQKMVGETPEISTNFDYAVSGDGVGKVTCDGCKLSELFPKCGIGDEFARTLAERARDNDAQRDHERDNYGANYWSPEGSQAGFDEWD